MLPKNSLLRALNEYNPQIVEFTQRVARKTYFNNEKHSFKIAKLPYKSLKLSMYGV